MLEKVETVKTITSQLFEEIVPQWNFSGGRRGNDHVACDCNGVLMKFKPSKIGDKTDKHYYKLSRKSQNTWHALNDQGIPDPALPWLGLGGQLHWGCHKVSYILIWVSYSSNFIFYPFYF